MAARSDLFVSPDYYQLDDLLTEEQKHIREAVRNYVKKKFLRSSRTSLNDPNFPSRSLNN